MEAPEEPEVVPTLTVTGAGADTEENWSAPISIGEPDERGWLSKSSTRPDTACPMPTTVLMADAKWRFPLAGLTNQPPAAFVTFFVTVPEAPSRCCTARFVRLLTMVTPVVAGKRYSIALG